MNWALMSLETVVSHHFVLLTQFPRKKTKYIFLSARAIYQSCDNWCCIFQKPRGKQGGINSSGYGNWRAGWFISFPGVDSSKSTKTSQSCLETGWNMTVLAFQLRIRSIRADRIALSSIAMHSARYKVSVGYVFVAEIPESPDGIRPLATCMTDAAGWA